MYSRDAAASFTYVIHSGTTNCNKKKQNKRKKKPYDSKVLFFYIVVVLAPGHLTSLYRLESGTNIQDTTFVLASQVSVIKRGANDRSAAALHKGLIMRLRATHGPFKVQSCFAHL